jgi:hypothetical protein
MGGTCNLYRKVKERFRISLGSEEMTWEIEA